MHTYYIITLHNITLLVLASYTSKLTRQQLSNYAAT